MSGSRAPLRWASVARALSNWGISRQHPAAPARILVLHHLRLGDTLMLTPLIAKLRAQHPDADIVMTTAPAIAPLYAERPYGVIAHPFDPRNPGSVRTLRDGPRFDLALLPADNRWSWLARGMGARWIVGIAGDRPLSKNWPVDDFVPYSPAPTAFGDTAAELVAGPPPARYRMTDWPAPDAAGAPDIDGPYAVLHVGASTPLKRWPAPRWRALATALDARGMKVVWSAGPGEGKILGQIEPAPGEAQFAGTLGLPALWRLLARARLLVCPDTGVAHIGRLTGVPTVTLYGPGSPVLCGPGDFFADMPGRSVTVDPFPCRDQTTQFFRNVAWARRCERAHGAAGHQCPRALCMEAIDVAAVMSAIDELLCERVAPR